MDVTCKFEFMFNLKVGKFIDGRVLEKAYLEVYNLLGNNYYITDVASVPTFGVIIHVLPYKKPKKCWYVDLYIQRNNGFVGDATKEHLCKNGKIVRVKKYM